VKFYYNSASNVGKAIKTFFDYSLLNINENSPPIFYRSQEEDSTISMARPSYFVLSCYDYISDPGETLSNDFQTNHLVLFYDFHLPFH